MKRILFFLSAISLGGALLFAPVATASPPVGHDAHFPNLGHLVYPAGTFCDFEFAQDWSGETNVVDFGDGSFIARALVTVTDTNLDTNVAFTERTSTVYHSDAAAGKAISVGVFMHVRDATGKLVVVAAGRVVFDFTLPDPLVSFTPNTVDYPFAVCTALGGHPA